MSRSRRALRRLARHASGWATRLERALLIDWSDAEFDLSDELPGDTPLEQAAHALARADRVVVFVGSGLSAESGIATFRDKGGVYDAPVDATHSAHDEGLWAVTQASTFETRPEWQLEWHQRWRVKMRRAAPNPGHLALAGMSGPSWLVATQNVDMLLERAARDEGRDLPIVHLHGDIETTRCHDCGAPTTARFDDWTDLPPCPVCGGRLRPGVVWFGEPLPDGSMSRVTDAARMAQVCLIVGTSGVVYPAASIPETAARYGARLIEINPEDTALSERCDVLLRANAAQILPELRRAVMSLRDASAR